MANGNFVAKDIGLINIHLAMSRRQGHGSVEKTTEAMKLHLAERDPQHHSWAKNGVDKQSMKLKILLSYHYYKKIDLDKLFAKYFTNPYPEVFADSGAFSSMTQGIKITCDEYADWVKKWKHLFCTYANLDVIKDAEGTLKNQRYLEDKHGLKPLPAFHVLEDFSYLEYYIDNYPYIALGVAGMQNRRGEIIRWLIKCFKMAGDKAVYHGFGLTSWNVMKSFRWYSVDSSSWGKGFRFGKVPVFDKEKGRFIELPLGDGRKWAKHGWLVKSLGFNPLDFADRKRNDRAKICAISALSYMMAEQWLRKLHGSVTIPGLKGAPEVLRGHLADANPARLKEASQGVGLYLADTSSGINYGDADKGIKLHLADSRPQCGSEIAAAETGLKIHLAEHSLDRGG